MKTHFLIILLSLSTFAFDSARGQNLATVKDLKPLWTVYEDGKFIPVSESSASSDVVYFKIAVKDYPSSYLKVEAAEEVALFINNNLAGTSTSFALRIDSLGRQFATNSLTIAIYQKNIKRDALITEVAAVRGVSAEDTLMPRRSSAFSDFVVTGMLLLVVFAVVIVRVNPKLAADYFSIGKIVSAREVDEGQNYTRIGSSTNVLFYAYSSMLLAYYLIVIFQYVPARFPLAAAFQSETYLTIFLDWVKLSFAILLLFFAKIVLVFALSYLFGFGEVAGVHFFNWVRLLLVILGVLVSVLFLYVIWHGRSVEVHSSMLVLLGWFNAVWIILIFLKLAGKAGASLFHLFSYICATELIPFLFIIKVLYN